MGGAGGLDAAARIGAKSPRVDGVRRREKGADMAGVLVLVTRDGGAGGTHGKQRMTAGHGSRGAAPVVLGGRAFQGAGVQTVRSRHV
jgi:hypothetical protein